MQTKTFVYAVIFFLFLCVSKTKAQTVYITESGKKYHAKNCTIAKTGKKGIELSEAKKQGFEPCKVCEIKPGAGDEKKLSSKNAKK